MPERAKRGAAWTKVAFGDVVRQVKDRVDPEQSGLERYVAGEHMETDDLRLRRWGDIGDGYLGPAFHMRFKPGHVLYGSRRTYLRKVAVADFEGITANTTYVLEPKNPNVLLPELLPFIMQTEAFNQHSVRESKGSVNPYVNFSDLAWYEFALPPIEEQRHLADALRATETASEMEGALAERSVLVSHALLERHLHLLGPSAQRVLVGDLLIDGPKNGLSPKANSGELGLRTVSIGAVSNGVFDPTGHEKVADLTPEEASPYLVRKGDVFAVRGNGNRQLVARVGQANESYHDLIYPDLLIRMRFDATRIVADYLIAQWNHPSVHARLLSHAKSSNGIWKVNGQDIRRHELVVPPLQVQEDIGRSLRSCITSARAADRRKATLAKIKASIMKRTVGVHDD